MGIPYSPLYSKKSVILISSLVAGSEVGGSVALKVLHAAGCRCELVPTVLLGRHPGLGAPGGGPVPSSLFGGVLKGLRDNNRHSVAHNVFCGYFSTAEQVDQAAQFIRAVKSIRPDLPVTVDPILGDGQLYVPESVAEAIRDLLVPLADLITPNRFELAWLSGRALDCDADIVTAARTLGPDVLVTSALEGADTVSVIGVENHTAWRVDTPRHENVPKGTGDLFAALVLKAQLADLSVMDAARMAVKGVDQVLTNSRSDDLYLDPALFEAPKDWPMARRLNATRPAWAIGLDGAPGGWVGVMVDMNGIEAPRAELFADFQAVLDRGAQIIAVDMPIGFEAVGSKVGMRVCEREARAILGPRRASIFPSPLRPALYAEDYRNALQVNRQLGGKGLSKQAYNITPKMREIDQVMTPNLEGAVYETHPETSFAVLAGTPAHFSKKTVEGRAERLALLETRGLPRDLFEPHGFKRKDCAPDDLIDAGLCALTALRIADNHAVSLPENPPRDDKGLRMAIWV